MSGGLGKGRSGDWFACPHCGAVVPAGALACPECGSDEETGWAEGADQAAADIPAGYAADDEFDYDDFIAREFGEPRKPRQRGRRRGVWIFCILAAIGLLLIFLIVAASAAGKPPGGEVGSKPPSPARGRELKKPVSPAVVASA